ncbi:hypothetical protein GJW-30_1_03345 [Variibacter gotjawalensis]|uniref:DUF1849 family protein n=1 Tax=Variibacter gotjawalensis TaxID=1333996 RepID=A0A0S3PY15_9BRAD|nr:cell envelope integrity EipB family protein [Variibacter gotjawalensis]NIK46630.1 hypothetical protein [Variibacter gotjawalensis]RZS48533.1 uncharacterized protein DUF1849 [Variibacter gotjawalensis]BAT60795.1 hypothetical protein GJW-30_1_03345 [Variibacter gotjawalensis]
MGYRSNFAGLALVALLGGTALAQPPDQAPLAGHRAVYDLSLVRTSGKDSLDSVRGRILYDFAGSPCEGYTLNFRQVTELDSGEGKKVTSDLRTTNFEDGDGSSFRFVTQNFLDNKPADHSEGQGSRSGAKSSVKLTKPAAKTVELGDVIFPSEHMRQIIITARDGKKLLEVAVYDGSDNGEKIYNSLTVIGGEIAAGAKAPDDAAAGQASLASLKRWPVTISYFEKGKNDGDQTPAYAISFEIYENGVARAIKIDYGTFALDGKLSGLEMREAKACK